MNTQQTADLFTSVDDLERRLLVLTAKHACLWSLQPSHPADKLIWSTQIAETGREIVNTMKKLRELTGDDQYLVK